MGSAHIERNALVVMDAAGTGECGYIDGSGACPYQRLRGGACSGACGEDVIHEQDASPLHRRWIGDLECAANILTALARREAGLTLGGAQAHECSWSESQMPAGMRLMKRVDGALGKGACLVEAALFVFGAVEWHGNDKHLSGRIRSELNHGRGEHRAEPARRWMDAVVLQSMDGCAHATVVGTERNGACKRWRGEAASAAELRGNDAFDWRPVKVVPASPADGAVMHRNFSPAGIANWGGRELRQGRTAEGAGGRKEGGTDCVQRTSKDARNGAPTGCLRKWTVDRQ